ncbi:MAG TPA: hypothetical protein VE467_19355 [Chryseolinea sp.]|nr:hypothetical protein [Chryseolinea sp.]
MANYVASESRQPVTRMGLHRKDLLKTIKIESLNSLPEVPEQFVINNTTKDAFTIDDMGYHNSARVR